MSGAEETKLRAQASNQESFSKLIQEFNDQEIKFQTQINEGFDTIEEFSKQQAELRILCFKILTRYYQSDTTFRANIENRGIMLRATCLLEIMNLGLDSNGR